MIDGVEFCVEFQLWQVMSWKLYGQSLTEALIDTAYSDWQRKDCADTWAADVEFNGEIVSVTLMGGVECESES